MYAIETRNLRKVFKQGSKKEIVALDDFNINVEQGTIFGLLGPNGAGKTTLIKILMSITFPTSGTAAILGRDISETEVKRRIGYLPENHKYPNYFKGGEVLRYFGRLSGIEGAELETRINYLLELVNLTNWKNSKVKIYSKGMMQRLGLAQALINDPDLIFLDEPTDGVDPIGRKEIRDILETLKNEGKTVFLNSHLLSEVELITDKVAILNKGKLIKEGKVNELTEQKHEYRLVFSPAEDAEMKLNDLNLRRGEKGDFILQVNTPEELNRILDVIRGRGITIIEMSPYKKSLEDMFISIIKKAEEGGGI
jgi:ABC-2 type transport system ATP-binding protein